MGRPPAPPPLPPARGSAAAASALPIDAHRERILRHIANNRVTVINGETGCGKSSRVPAMIAEHCGPSTATIITTPAVPANARSMLIRIALFALPLLLPYYYAWQASATCA